MLFFGRGFDNNVVAGLPYFFFLFPISTGFLLIICFILLSSFFFLYLLRLVVWKEAWWCVRVLGVNAVRCVCVCVCKFTTLFVCLWFFFCSFYFPLINLQQTN